MWQPVVRWLNRILRPGRQRRGEPRRQLAVAHSAPAEPEQTHRALPATRRRISTTVEEFDAHLRNQRR